MEKEFKEFSNNIRLTENQENDAKTKYTGVCKTLHKAYYENEYDGKTKLLFGSYKTKTNTRPLSKDQDVDVLFKIPRETYEKFKNYKANGPSALLQEIKEKLKATYSTTEEVRGWGKVVLIKFNSHNVELLPAFEEEDETFTIPNSEDGGSWEPFDPREQISKFQSSNQETDSLTADLTRMLKTWVKNTSSLDYKSYDLLNDTISFLDIKYKNGANYSDYHLVIKECFSFLKSNYSQDSDLKSHLETALNRAEKAVSFINENKPKEASLEWRKIFGNEYPLVHESPEKDYNTRVFSKPSSPYVCYKTK